MKYFDDIRPIFDSLALQRKESNATKTWKSLGDYHTTTYVPILDAFKKELIRLDRKTQELLPKDLLNIL